MQNRSRQHGKMFFDLIEKGIHGDKLVIYTLIYDRMQSSVTRDAFYDKKMQRHYVIYTVNELADFIGISDRTVGKFIKELVEAGLLKIKRQFSKANKIFIPDFDEEATLQELKARRDYNNAINEHFSVSYAKNVPTNQINYKQTNQQINTNINTENLQKSNENQAEEVESVSFDSWIDSTANGYSMNRLIPEIVAKYARYFANPKDFAYRMIGTISRVRGFIAKKFGIKHSELSQFDSNSNFGTKLADKIKSIMIHVIAKKMTDMGQILAYLNKSLQNFFTQATGKGFKTAQPGFAPSMTDETADYKAKSQAKKQAVTPQWLKDQESGIEQKAERPTIFDALKMKVMLLSFDDGVHRDIEGVFVPKIKSLMAKYGISMDVRTPEDDGSELGQAMGAIESQILAI